MRSRRDNAMSKGSRFRDAASVHVDASPDRVRELITDPKLLQAIDDRLAREDVEIEGESDHVEVRGDEGRLEFAFRLHPEGDGTRIAVLENVEPDDWIETTKWMLFPRRAHEDLERELDRLRHLVEAFEASHGG